MARFKLYDNGTTYDKGQIEFYPPANNSNYGGFIDFHYNQSSADYTSRIIENASGKLNLIAILFDNVHINFGELFEGGTAISLSGHTHSYLPLSGGTITGGILFKSSTLDNTVAPSSMTEHQVIAINDKNNKSVLQILGGRQTDGRSHACFGARCDDGSTVHLNRIYCYVKNDGTCSYLVSDPAAFRTAISAAASSHSHSYLPLSGGTLTGRLTGNGRITLPTAGGS